MFNSDQEILRIVEGFKELTLPKAEWTHEAHLVTAVWHHRNYSEYEALCLLRSGIIAYNISTGGKNTPTDGYHETLTLFWSKVIRNFVLVHPAESLLELCQAFLSSDQASKDLPLKFYTREVLFSVRARATWVSPDLGVGN